MLLELRYALRRLRTSPGFAITAIVTLALAIGTTTAMVGVLDAVLFRRLPFPQADRLVVVWQELPSQAVREARSAFGTADEWRRASRSLDDVAVLDPVTALLDHAGEVERVSGSRVSPNLFALLGVVPERGRLFTEREAADRQRVAVISHRFWQARFASSPEAIGATVLIDGQPSQIVGVLPESLANAGFAADVWEPHTMFADWEARRAAIGRGSWFVFGRLRADAHVEATQRELGAIARRLDVGQPDADAGRTVRVVPLREQLAGARPTRDRLDAGRRDRAAVAGGRGQRRRADHRPRPRAPAAARDPGGARRQPRPPRAIAAGGERRGGGARRPWRPGGGGGGDRRDPRVRTGLRGASRRRPPRRRGCSPGRWPCPRSPAS